MSAKVNFISFDFNIGGGGLDSRQSNLPRLLYTSNLAVTWAKSNGIMDTTSSLSHMCMNLVV